MKIMIISLALISLTCLAFAQESGINFEQGLSWQQIKEKAKTQNKFIFVDVFATWCGPCKEMDRITYVSDKVGTFMNDRFISVKVQIDKTEVDSETTRNWYADARQIQSEYSINTFPTLLFFSPKGNLVKRAGFTNAEGLLTMAYQVVDSAKAYDHKLEKYKSKKVTPVEIRDLAMSASKIGDQKTAQKIADDYINNYLFKGKQDSLFKKDNLVFIGNYIGNAKSPAYDFFTKHQNKIDGVLGEHASHVILLKFINQTYLPQQSTWSTTKPDWDRLEKNLKAKFGALGNEITWGQRMLYHFILKDDWKSFGKYYMLYMKRSYRQPLYEVNNMSWAVFENINDHKVLSFACDTVMRYALEEWYSMDFIAYDTYANLLYKTGKLKQALEWERRAIRLAKGWPDENSLVQTLDKMSKGAPTWIVSATN